MLAFDVEYDNTEVKRLLKRLRGDMPRIQRKINTRYANSIIGISQKKYLNASPGNTRHLHSRSGRLSSSLRYWFNSFDQVSIGTNIIYAAVHEFEPGTTIRAKNVKYLRFKIGDRWVSRKKVFIPARPYVRPPIDKFFDTQEHVRIGELTLKQEFRKLSA